MSQSILSNERKCYVCGDIYNLHKHHIFMGAYRKKSEEYGCWVYLRADWHNMSNYGVHFNRKLDLKLKREAQAKFEEIYGHKFFMQVFGKNYL